MFSISMSQIKLLVPHAQGEYLAAFSDTESVLNKYNINNRLRVCHFIAQILAETGGFRIFEEDLSYSAARLMIVWSKHFHTLAEAEPYTHNPEALGNFIYGPQIHPDLGNTQPGDGYRFRGRGLLQMTGRAAYEKYGTLLGVSFLNQPSLVYDHRYSLAAAAAEFSMSKHSGKNANQLSDMDDIEGVTYAVNGGLNGLDNRKYWLAKAKNTFKEEQDGAAASLVTAEISLEGSSRAIANVGKEPEV